MKSKTENNYLQPQLSSHQYKTVLYLSRVNENDIMLKGVMTHSAILSAKCLYKLIFFANHVLK